MPANHPILDNKTVIHCDYLNGEQIYNLLDATFEIPTNGFQFNVVTVSSEYVARPDLISLDAYGSTIYSGIICKLNGISNPFELNEGIELIIPTAQYISYFQTTPDDSDLENENNLNSKPVATTKSNKKRKANEALVNDSRFKIDSASGIIIY